MTTRPSVLHVSETVSGGVAGVIAHLAEAQRRRGWVVHVAGPPRDGFERTIATLGVTWHDWHATGARDLGVVGEVRDLGRLVATTDPDVVHLHSAKAGLAGRLALRGRRPTLFQPHNWSFDVASGRTAWAARTWERLAADRWTDVVVCVSEAEARSARAAGLRTPLVVAPNGVDTDRFHPRKPDERARLRQHLGVVDGRVVLYVGRLTEEKGLDVLLQAWRRVGRAVRDAQLVLVGPDPPGGAAMRDMPPRVVTVGPSDDVASWYAAADVFVLPSRTEAMPLVVLEAMSTGLPVVATAVGGVPEVVVDGTGALVEPGRPDALADALIDRLSDPDRAREEGRRARAHVLSAHTLDAASDRIDQAYEVARAAGAAGLRSVRSRT